MGIIKSSKAPMAVVTALACVIGFTTPASAGETEAAAAAQKSVQLNERQPYTYDRDTLVRRLDEALAALKE